MYWFALFLVLFEFTAYAANDMIMPGMLQVVRYFHVPEYYVAQALSFYLLGNCLFLLIVGYLAERHGKSKIILWGNFLFLVFTVLIVFSKSINQFMLLRFLQGIGLTVIPIGYAIIHEKFNDKSAIKLQSLMANISLLAPLLGPAIGSLIMSIYSWQYIFILTACLATFTWIGLFRFTPKDTTIQSTLSIKQVTKDYSLIVKSKEFCMGMICTVFLVMPLLLWISQAPNLILYKLQLSYSQYVMYQIISIGGLTISSILMQFIVGRYRMYSIVMIGSILVLIGSLIFLLGFNHIGVISIGMMIYALGMGLANGCLWRLLLTIKGHSHAMLAAMLGCLQTLFLTIGVVVFNEVISYYHFSFLSFTLSSFIFGFLGFLVTIIFIGNYRNRGWL